MSKFFQEQLPIRIAVFTGFFYPHLGGHEKYVEELYRRLPSQKFTVDIVTCNTDRAPTEEDYRGFHIYRFNCWNILGGTFPIPKPNRVFWRLLGTLRHRRYSMVNTHTRFFTNALVGTLFAAWVKAFHIHTEHGTNHPCLTNPVTRIIAWWYDHTVGWFVIKHAASVTAISRASGKFAQHLGAKSYTVFPNCVDGTFFHPPPRVDRQEKEKLWVTFVGRLIQAKGVQDLLAVWRQMTLPHAELHIVGNGPYAPQLHRQAEGLNDVVFHGSIMQNDILTILQQTDILVNPSYGEGLPTSVLEAGACACAVIATDVGGTREIFPEELQSWLVASGQLNEMKNNILILSKDAERRRRIGEVFATHVRQHFDWEVMSRRFAQWLETWSTSTQGARR